MITRLKMNTGKESGQVLIMVLALLALGGLTIAGSLNYSSTIIYDTRISGYAMDCMYSAGAGVEYVIWAMENDEVIPAQLSDNVNGKMITLDIQDKGIFKLYCGDLIYVDDLPPHYDWLTASGSAVCEDGTCNYTISINYNGDAQQRKITEVGMKLPDDYDYVDSSSSLFPDNITFDDPDEEGEGSAGRWIRWLWNPGSGPVISDVIPSVNQTFMIEDPGAGAFGDDDHYTWVQIQSVDIGIVGEITGERHTITSTAIGPATVDSVVEADVIIVGGTVYIMSWQILD
ncbi:MAG TPA: hypothetical protein G4O15_05425 [Dehalococcoidia bacterium]|nr:hypothetical protein [Dehalococcoidia bacterium]